MAKKKKDTGANDIVAALQSRYPGKVFNAAQYHMPWMLKRLPTGILDLDIALQGGFPAGGLSFLVGEHGVGKSWMANQVIREQQLIYGDECMIGWVSTEMPYDKVQGQSCGVAVPMSGIELEEVKQTYKEVEGSDMPPELEEEYTKSIGTFITVPPGTAEESLDIALSMIASRQFHVVVIDSFGSLLTNEDNDKDLDEANRVGGASGLNTRFSRKLNSVLTSDKNGEPNLTCVIGLNQVRDNMNRANKYSPTKVETGGWALKHARWVTVEMTKGKLKEGTNRVGSNVRWEITKQKAGGHEGARGEFAFLYSMGGIDYPVHTLGVAADMGVVNRAGAWFSYEGNKLGQGLPKAAKTAVDAGIIDEIRDKCLKIAGIRCPYK